MKFLRELFGNIPMFQRNVERELEAKGIEPTDKIKRAEHSRQVTRKAIFIGGLAFFIIGATFLYFKNKSEVKTTVTDNQATQVEKPKNNGSENGVRDSGLQQEEPSNLVKMTEKQRSEGALKGFEDWYNSFNDKDVVLSIDEKQLKEPIEENLPGMLKQELISSLIKKFGNTANESYENILQQTYSRHHISIDEAKGLTVYNQLEEPSTWLNTWYLDSEKAENNTKFILRNDFSYGWVDWRNDGRKREVYEGLFNSIDWDNELGYEVISVILKDNEKNLISPDVVFVVMEYNETLDKWQLGNNIGGVM